MGLFGTYSLLMRKTVSGLAISLVLAFPLTNASASSTVPYKNQRAGQFCKSVDVGKSVKLPDGKKLKCTMDGARARWKK
jgi:hypothetical protein